MANNKYDATLKNKIIRLYLEDGRSMKSLTEEYNLGIGLKNIVKNAKMTQY